MGARCSIPAPSFKTSASQTLINFWHATINDHHSISNLGFRLYGRSMYLEPTCIDYKGKYLLSTLDGQAIYSTSRCSLWSPLGGMMGQWLCVILHAWIDVSL